MSCVLPLLHFLNRPFWAHEKECRKMFFIQRPSSGNAPHFLMAEACIVLSSAGAGAAAALFQHPGTALAGAWGALGALGNTGSNPCLVCLCFLH